MKLKNIPNLLSFIRICLVFVFVALFWVGEIYWALFVFFLAGATDVLDGYLARRNNWITNLGKILDPFADKLMQCTVLICLWVGGYIPWWFVVPYFAKEIFTLAISFVVIKRRSVAVVSKWYGKMAVCLFYVTIGAATIFQDFFLNNELLGIILFIPAIVCTFFALGAYIKHYAWLKHTEVKKGDISDMLNIRKEK